MCHIGPGPMSDIGPGPKWVIGPIWSNLRYWTNHFLFGENNVHTANNLNFNIWGGCVKSAENVAGPTSKIGPNWSNVPHGTGSEKVVGPIPKIGPNWSYVLHGTGSNLWHWTWSNVAHGTGILLTSSLPGQFVTEIGQHPSLKYNWQSRRIERDCLKT